MLVVVVVQVLPTRSVIKILKLISHSTSVFFIRKVPEKLFHQMFVTIPVVKLHHEIVIVGVPVNASCD
ncbi:hypothetical protein KKG31_04955 [Patescibacteria group bacterium]|nr:hypothetical protein [Patescibacteria group bacterium]MBU1758472.1 hypothetical protein [Patescibacteria group bacterium]